jgi:pantoate--beta-alanine ligase
MLIFHRSNDLSNYLQAEKKKGKTIGFVPTMGALHKGHLNLVQRAIGKIDLSLCSIFINPTQFNNPADFKKYPTTIQTDIQQLLLANCDLLFLPTVEEIYPSGLNNLLHYDLGFLETVLEGSFRPGHFQGVCQVMDRLLSIINPTDLFMGMKDYQQCMVVQKLIEIKNWQEQIHFHACPTLREGDGLAMSSRNLRLSVEQREKAVVIYQTLQYLQHDGFKIDYVEIADANTLHLIDDWDGQQQLCALIAAFTGEVRLIDNMILNP